MTLNGNLLTMTHSINFQSEILCGKFELMQLGRLAQAPEVLLVELLVVGRVLGSGLAAGARLL